MAKEILFEGGKLRVIYVFRINDEAHAGCLKVGMATAPEGSDAAKLTPNSEALNDIAKNRISEYTQTAAIAYELLHTELAFYHRDGKSATFEDHDVHEVLERSGISRKEFKNMEKYGREWYEVDLATVRNAIAAVKEGRRSLSGKEVTKGMSPIVFRPEQRRAIDGAVRKFRTGNDYLWDAKMRFGKTLSALQVIREMGMRRTLILTHRPTVDAGWFEDFSKIFYDKPEYRYGSKNYGESFVNLNSTDDPHFVYFASMQDLRGSEAVGGAFDKNSAVFSTKWDLIIVDEAHEGTRTNLGQRVVNELRQHGKPKVLQLSGTPFNLMRDYEADEIFSWTYVDEQLAKIEWEKNHMGDHNPYACLPVMNTYTYDLGRLMGQFVDGDISFNFTEFFRTHDKDGSFVHETDVVNFLNILTRTDDLCLYPFSNDRYRQIFRHTLWMVPGVSAARALSSLLKKHQVFQHYHIVNVAGDGDLDVENDDALRMVNEAIGPDPDKTLTITLSCGRLTTGVSVKAWTGVLMLSGSYKTAASTYMQTIFRVQTPATIGGRVKDQCYVFDFAPDRALQVMAESVLGGKAPKNVTSDQRTRLGQLLNFCPIIAFDGSEMKKISTEKLLQEVKRAYVERVVNRGFEDDSLYNDLLLDISDKDLFNIGAIRGKIGEDRAQPKTGEIVVNNQGLDNEEYEKIIEKIENKNKRQLSPEELALLEARKKKLEMRRNVISVLRLISIRMPLLIYGADIKDEAKELTIDNFIHLVDDRSWAEFMPAGVDKKDFKNIKKFYDPDVFAAAGRRIREKIRAADNVTVEERIGRLAEIFSTFKNPDKETVLTPWRVVNMHLGETLGGYCFFDGENYDVPLDDPRFIDRGKVTASVFAPNACVLEINSKSGLYPLYVAYNAYRSQIKDMLFSLDADDISQCQEVWDRAVSSSVFVICKTPMARQITIRTLSGFRRTAAVPHAVYVSDLVDTIRTSPDDFAADVLSLNFWKLKGKQKNMNFKAVVGNPPYQETVAQKASANGQKRVVSIFQYFQTMADKLGRYTSLIYPGMRWIHRSGKGMEKFGLEQINDPRLELLEFFPNANEVFNSVGIADGLSIVLKDNEKRGGASATYSVREARRRRFPHSLLANRLCRSTRPMPPSRRSSESSPRVAAGFTIPSSRKSYSR